MRALLEDALSPTLLEIEDESARHRGHAGAADGRGHFRLRIACEQFRDMSSLQRHRTVFAALGDMMNTDIHALSIDAEAPGEG
ncbi:MAG: BolA family protein [Gammaproteobacteria bacterium]|nr:BolA family protein [Gammaproteobacteria bacterium]